MADIISLTVPIEGEDTTLYLKDAKLRGTIADVKDYIGYVSDKVIGLQADFENSIFTRLGAAVGKNAGTDFDVFKMYGGRKLCNLADDGTVNAWYGDTGYIEDGSNGQVMVWQPKFYYKTVPLKMDPITDGEGYHLRKVNYYISDEPLDGFKVHPAFLDADGNEVDGYYIGAYEACLYDDSEGEYRKYDTWDVSYDSTEDTYTINALNTYLADANNDKLSSIAGVKPASGEYSTQFTRPNVNKMATNRGAKWTGVNFKIVSAEQLLFVIEYATFDSQAALGNGVVSFESGSHNESVFTGSTSALGNSSGAAASTSRLVSDGTYETTTTNSKVSVRYRGVENFFGNIWACIHGVNIHGNGSQRGGIPYYCTDFNYEENKNSGNYVSTHITMANSSSYVSAFGYSTSCDWAFIPTEGLGNSTKPVGDYIYVTQNLNSYCIARLGGYWHSGVIAGAFHWHWYTSVGYRHRTIGGRLARLG